MIHIDEVNKVRKTIQRRSKHLDESRSKLKILLSACPHESRNEIREYSSGGYDYKGRTSYYSVCTLCGDKKLLENIYKEGAND